MHVKSLHFVCIFLHICSQFEFLRNSQDSAATDLRCVMKYYVIFVTNFLLFLALEDF